MMARFIDVENVDELIDSMYMLLKDCQLKRRSGCLADNCKDCMKRFFTYTHILPTADVAKVKHGKWEEEYLGYGTYRYRCSECNSTFGEDAINEFHHKNYCSNCGARMDLEEREEE